MRPACAYPILQTNITNGPDLYRERDTFNYGVANSQPLPVQPMGSNQAMYHGSVSAPGLSCPNTTMSPQPQMPTQQSHFQMQQYPQMQQSYGDAMGNCQVSSFQPQQQYPTMILNSNLDKVASQQLSTSESPPNLNYIRNSNMNGALPHSQIMPNTTVSYGLPSAPNCSTIASHQPRTPLISMGTQNIVNRNIPQSQQICRPSATRVVSSESVSFQPSSMYLPYSSECPVSQPGSGIAAPYSVAMSTCNTIPQVINNAMVPGSVGCPGQSPRPPAGCRNQVSSNAPTSTPVMQQQQMYSSQQSRSLNNSSVYSGSCYGNQQYTQPSPAFRPSPSTMNSQTTASVVTRSTTPRDAQGNNCLTMHHTLPQQLPVSQCSSNPSSIVGPGSLQSGVRSIGSCNVNSGTTIYNHPCTPAGHSVPSAIGSNQTVAPNPSTPPYVMPNGNSRVMGSHVNPGVGDLCYLPPPPSRPISSGGREVVMTAVSVGSGGGGGPVVASSGNEMMLNSNFHISTGLNPSTSTSFSGNNSQIPGLHNDFDGSVPNSSPLMMMTMPVSSPIPGNFINGPIHANVMNMSMVSSAPAPPPYHQPTSMMPCRSVGPSFFSPTSMSMPPITVTSAVYLNSIPTFSTVPDPGSVNNSDRGMYGITGENVIGSSVNSKQTSATNKTRPKRVRGSKTSSGVGRGSRVNSKKNLTANTIPSVSSSESFSPGQRPVNQQSKKLQSWNNGSSANVNFNSTMISPTQSMGIPMVNSGFIGNVDRRESPVTFATQSNGGSIRPNSGPPANNNSSISTTGITYNESSNNLDTQSNHNMRLPVSPQHSYCSSQVPMQQQQYSVSNTSNNCTSYSSGHGNNAFYNQINQHVSNINMNTSQQTLTSNNNQICYSNVGPPNGNTQPPPPNVHYQSHAIQPNSNVQTISSSMTSNCNRISAQSNSNSQNYPPPAPLPPPPSNSSSTTTTNTMAVGTASYTYTDRLVCPITNGMVWGPTQMQLNDVMHQYLPEGIYVRRFEFDLTANHLSTIVGRSDLDIVVCSHLLSEPLQVCHWPPDAVQIRFNDYLLRLDRSSVNGGQPAHKVACVKQLCRPGRNQLEIAILGLGEDPNQPSTMAKRRATAQTLEAHRFAAFMAHMPALNVLLDGLQRRRPAGVNTLCDILEGRIGTRNLNEDGSVTRNTMSGPSQTPVIAELNLVCPVFRTRMRIPGRIAGCQHVEAFDMEAFLRREVLWPRLNCPICGHKSPAGLDGLCIDTTILYASQLVPQSAESILVRSDGYWRLVPPLCLDLPNEVDQWQPLIGPLTEVVSQAFNQISSKGSLRGQNPSSVGVRQITTHCHTNVSQTIPDWNQSPLQRISPQQQQQPPPKIASTSRKPQPLHATSQTTKVVTSQQDMVNSPQWVSDSCSPSNQTNSENICSNTSCGPVGELVDSAYSSAASRPSSQPVSWIGTQSSPDKISTSISLPSSPSISTRSVSCFSMAAIPGVNMCVVDSMSSTSSSLSTASTYTTMMTKSFLSTSVSSNITKGVIAEQCIDIGSDNSYHTPMTTTSTTVVTTSSNGFSTDEMSSKSVGTSEYTSPSTINLESSSSGLTSSTRRCPTSSLNMGLDFLLTEDQTITSTATCSDQRSPQMSSTVVSDAVRSLLTSTSDTVGSSISPTISTSTTNSDDFPVNKMKCTYNSCSEQSTSPKSENISSNREQPSDCGDTIIVSSFLNKEENCKLSNQLISCTPKVENDVKISLNEINDEETPLILNEVVIPTKRIKLESPQISPQISLHTCVAEQISNLPDKQDDDLSSTKQSTASSLTTTTLNDELYKVKNVISGNSNEIENGSYPGYVGLINNDFDEEKVSIELIHSVSSKIDQLDLFLDESYIRFVEHFPCV